MSTPTPPQHSGFPGAVPREPAATDKPPLSFPEQFPSSPEHLDSPQAQTPSTSPQLAPHRKPWTQPEEDADSPRTPGSWFSRSTRSGDPAALRAMRAVSRVAINDAFPDAYAAAVDHCQRPVTTGRRIGIMSPSGGAGKSTLAAAAALLLSGVRVDHIAAVDLAGRPSGLQQRLPSESDPAGIKSLAEVVNRRDQITLADLRSHSAQLRSTLHRVTLHDQDSALQAEDVSGTFQVLSHTCAVSLIELPELSPELGTAPLSNVHALILAVPPSPAAAASVRSLLEKLHREVPETPILPVIVDTQRARAADRRTTATELKRHLREIGYPTEVRSLDADRHLASGLQINLKRVGEQRRLQIAQLTAAALTAAAIEPSLAAPKGTL